MTPCEAEEKMIIVLGGTVGNSEEAVAHGLGFGCFRMMLMMTKKNGDVITLDSCYRLLSHEFLE